ncbi:glycosyltransferase family 2 protein [Patescibacteria group bacterium]
MRVFIIIVNYNGDPYILECLKSLYKSDISNFKVDILIVDNKSSDNSIEKIKTQFPKVKIVKNQKNLGFAAACNRGIKISLQSKAQFIFLLNPDTVVEKKLVKPLIETAKKENKIGIISPLLKDKYRDKDVYTTGLEFNKIIGKTSHKHYKDRPKNIIYEDLVSGCAMFIKTEVFNKIGFFDERFFMYFEDSDFCLRAKAAGFKIVLEPQVVVNHEISKSTGKKSKSKAKNLIKSNLIFILKHTTWYFWPLSFIYLLALFFKLCLSFIS